MNIDENDLMFTNRFIRTTDDIRPPSGVDYNAEFEKVYTREKLRPMSSVSFKSTKSSGKSNNEVEVDDTDTDKRYIRSVPTLVTIDSRDRDTILYPTANSFRSYLPRNFYNIKSIRLASMEFPNTNAVINSTNNNIYWINKEDIDLDILDTITQTYPIYKSTLRIGSYIASKLENEIESQLNAKKRRGNIGAYHYFIPNLDIETDVVSFTSLILTKLGSSPIDSISGTSVLTVNATAHGYVTGDTVYIIGSRTVAGIPGSEINEVGHIVTVINADKFQFEVVTNASTTTSAGGSNVNTGTLAPFKLLYGTYQKTVAPNIGYPFEDSSEQIVTYISSMVPFIQVQISTLLPHNLSASDISLPVTLSSTGTTPSIDGVVVVSQILSGTSFMVSVSSAIDINTFNQGTVTTMFDTLDLTSVENFSSDTYLLTTYTPHNYGSGDTNLTLFETTTSPVFDGINTIFSILSSTQLVLYGEILAGGSSTSSIPGDIGYTPTKTPLTSHYFPITDIIPGNITTITVNGHNLNVGDKIKFYNVSTTPSLLRENDGVFQVNTIVDVNNITIAFQTTSVDLTDLSLSGIGTSLVTIKFPGHGFNSVISITNGGVSVLNVQTLLDHGFVTGDLVRLMETNCVPPVNGSYTITVTGLDTFQITSFNITTAGTFATIGMNLNFKLYNLVGFGGFSESILKNVDFTVKDIVDENEFTFLINNYFSTSAETGAGTGVFISSLRHGFKGVQENTKNGIIARSINLEGENYSLLTSKQLGSMLNTGKVTDIFARITLDNSPGAMCFNYLSNPKIFSNSPLDTLNYIDFNVQNYDTTLYEFNDLDYSFTLEITENVDTSTAFNINSKRNISDQADIPVVQSL
jgi:hypothetical protein